MALPTPAGVPVEMMSPGSSVHDVGDELDDGGHGEDLLAGAGVLMQLAVDGELHRQLLRIGDGVGRGDAGPHRAEAVVPFAVQPVEEAVLVPLLAAGIRAELAVGNVVDDRVAGDVFQSIRFRNVLACSANHHRQFTFPVDVLGANAGNNHWLARIGQRGGRRLHEDVGERLLPLRRFATPFNDVCRIVPRQQEQLIWPGNGGEEFHFVCRQQTLGCGTWLTFQPVGHFCSGRRNLSFRRQKIQKIVSRRQGNFLVRRIRIGSSSDGEGNHSLLAIEASMDGILMAKTAKSHRTILGNRRTEQCSVLHRQ